MISKATPNDIPALNNLVNSAYRGDSSRKGWTTEADLLDGTRTDEKTITDFFKDPNSTILKYVEAEQLLGCVRLVNRGGHLYLGMFAVDPVQQAKGIGKKLLVAAEEVALKQNCKSIDLTVISVRAELIAWYKRHGYVETGEKKPMVFDSPAGGAPKKELYFITLQKNLA